MVGTLYRRTRYENGAKIQRAEARFDDIAGCLRTPAGGSSRQYRAGRRQGQGAVAADIGARNGAADGAARRLSLPASYNEAYHLTGDGVVVPVVRHIAAHLIEPLLTMGLAREAA